MAKKTTKKRKLSGNALKQKAYALLKKGSAKLVRRRGKSYNTRYKCKKSKGVYIYVLKDR